jgi:cysteine desulfurase
MSIDATTFEEMVYLDNAATTKVDERVLMAMAPHHQTLYGNTASIHRFGAASRRALCTAREVVARVMGVPEEGIIFTSGGTEANGLAILGGARSRRRRGTVVLSAIEHPSVRDTAHMLEGEGYTVVEAPVNREGIVSLGGLDGILGPEVCLVSIMHANNEIGTIQPIEEVGRMIAARCPRALFHVDATQTFGRVSLRVESTHVDMVTASAHKIHGPKGVGTLWVGRDVKLAPIMGGGGQQGVRSGTIDVAGAVGFAEAALIMAELGEGVWEDVTRRRDRIIDSALDTIEEVTFVGERHTLVPHIVCLVFRGVKAETVVHHLDAEGVIVSSGAACSSSRRAKLSHVLEAIDQPAAEGAIRISLSRLTSDDEVDRAITALQKVIQEVRSFSSPSRA